ncbi:organellar oligopeptidase A, chloroplastic/mitochondrial-like [Salvia miltiorrhiza]|uniref:organellar oligopeptidase A, chloroplastic/mitochondrial-like n=1 Tax=Salvia miltiorrhiza TaxID=226208 RepID=UPI0025ABD2BD|nr:organellar oligopeptidase A, chloroplastic/mitochondrial-like [Salvia miltiorrhiza]
MASAENPLLQDFIFPPYDVIEPNHVCPAIQTLLIQLEKDLDELEKTVEPTWAGLVVPLEKMIDRLSVVWGIVNHLNSVKDCPQLRAAIQQVQPKKVEFQLKLRQSKLIYKAFKAIRDSLDWGKLSEARKRVVDLKLKEAVLYGVSLEDTSRERFNEIEQELEKLAQKFEENILDATKSFEKVITDKKEIEGLPLTTLTIAAEAAIVKGYENATADDGPWIITLDGPVYRSVLQHVCSRSLREEVFRAYVTRASDGPLNNTPIIERVLELRLEKAKLLGFKNYAEVSLEMKMATVDTAKDLIEKLHKASWGPAIRELEELRDYARGRGAQEANDLNQWDINFWSERLRESTYDFDEEELRPYFPLPKVMEGLFNLSKKLFEVDIEPADGTAPVWNKDVSFYKIRDSSGAPIAYFYFDPYSRPSEKRGGAWADLVVGRSGVCSSDITRPRLPITNVVCNLTPPTRDKPSLMTIREVEAVFHEFGHALQHLLTTQDEGLVSGNKGIEWDAVEIPSLFMENWCYQRETILSIAKHYESGEPLPENTCLRILRARTFRAGTLLLRQLRYAAVDLELHSTYVPGGLESIYDVDQEIGKRTHTIPLLPEDRFLCSFSHIFADKYAAGYYSYQWAEVLSADAFSAFEEAGLDDDQSLREMGRRFRETILALGGGKAPNEVFLEFRGREPTPDAFLRYNGLLPAVAAA